VLGIAPDDRGLLPEVDVKRLEEFGAAVRRLYGQPLATGGQEEPAYVAMVQPKFIDRVVLQEDLAHGQMVRRYRVEARVGQKWTEVARGSTIGYKRILVFEPVTAGAVRVAVEAAIGPVKLLPVKVYYGGE
jgi:alpha-L-fucosidase